MEIPPDHAEFLRRRDYPAEPAARLTGEERDALVRYGYWLEALADARLVPTTPEQERFVRVARGEAPPRTLFERAWTANREAARIASTVPEVDVARRLSRVESARAALAALDEEFQARKAAVLQKVQAELDAIDAEYSSRMDAAREACAANEREARTAVLAYGASFTYGRIKAVFARGRVTWDTKGLGRYMESHPELGQFRKVGPPTVSFRLKPPEPAGTENT